MDESRVTEDEHRRRIEARKTVQTFKRRGRCRRCRKNIPSERQGRAKFCTDACRKSYHWERYNDLKREIRLYKRAQKTLTNCSCGAVLDTKVKPGPPAKTCKKCKVRDQMRRYREKKKG